MFDAGSRPRGRGTFLCLSKEKYPKEKTPGDCAPLTRGTLRFSPDWAAR